MERKELMRTFVAIPVTLPAELSTVQGILKKELDNERIRWIPDTSMHLTLRFLGDTEPELVSSICQGMPHLFSGLEKFVIEFNGLGFFRHRSMLRVIWAGIRNPREVEKFRVLTDDLIKSFVHGETRKPFRPHLTLARIKRLDNPERVDKVVANYQDARLGSAVIGRVIFYESILKSGGPEYRKLKEVLLSG